MLERVWRNGNPTQSRPLAEHATQEKWAVVFPFSPGAVVHSFCPKGEAGLKDHELCNMPGSADFRRELK